MKELQQEEILYAVIEGLKTTLNTNDVAVEIKNTVRSMILNQQDKEVLSWLKLSDPLNNHNLARQKHEPTTGNWFLHSDTFKAWLTAPKSLLWVHGIPGSGKT